MQLDDNLKQLMKELGAAINDALSDSEEISEAIQNVRNAGYDVFLVLEATIGFNKRSRSEVSPLTENQHRRPGSAVTHISFAIAITSAVSIFSMGFPFKKVSFGPR